MSILPQAKLTAFLVAGTLLCNTAALAQSSDGKSNAAVDQDPFTRSSDAVAPIEGDAKIGDQSFSLNGGNFSVFPVPASNRLTVRYTAAKDGDLTLQLMNTQGHPVLPIIHTTVAEGEERKYYMNVSNLADGTYVLRAVQNSSVLARQVVVTH